MLAKLTSKNQITIPKKILSRLPGVDYFHVELDQDCIILKPVKIYETNLESIREKMNKLGLKEDCVAEAIVWAKSRSEES